ncbi:MAG: TPM domain-containing protein, partial [Bdellovibrionaceae bacterium]|nr:TPM domain-containing protein [Pseudobdellovibrionaceae bacterium]
MAVWVEKYLSAEDREAISQKIAEVESKTSAEIVPVLVPSSTSTGHVPWLLTSLFAIVILSLEGYWLDWIIGTVWMFLTPILLLLAYF